MIKLLIKLLLLPPELLTVHAQAYADLARQSWAEHLCTLKNRWVLFALSIGSLWLALVLAGVALLLWSALPIIDARHAWVLWALPSGLLVLSGLFWLVGRSLRPRPVWADIQDQLQLDMLMIRKAQTP